MENRNGGYLRNVLNFVPYIVRLHMVQKTYRTEI